MARTGNGAVSVSFFQKRICSCMVDPKMNQCADPIDTQHNVLFDVWRRNVPQWLDETTCGREGCICKEQGFRDMKSQDDLLTFLFCGECAAVADPTRKLPRDDSDPMQLRYDCVYTSHVTDGLLVEWMQASDADAIRPLPPPPPDGFAKSLKPGDEVDVWHEAAWWPATFRQHEQPVGHV